MRLENIIKFSMRHERASYGEKSIGPETPPSPPISMPRRHRYTGSDRRLLDLAQQYPKRSKSPTAVES